MQTDVDTGVDTAAIELIDLGDVREETRQYAPFPAFPDSTFGAGLIPDLG